LARFCARVPLRGRLFDWSVVATAEPPDKRSDEAKKSRWKEPSERKGRNEERGGREEAGSSREGAIGMREQRARKRKRKKKRKKEKEGMIGREREGQRGAR